MTPPPHSTSSRREPGSSSSPSPKTSNPTASPSPADPPTRRLSKDSEGYPSWLPKRPPPPAPASTLGAASHIHFGETPSPVEGYETYGEFGDDVFGRDGDAFISGETEENVHSGADTEADFEYPGFAYDHEHEHEIGLEPRRRPRGPQGLATDAIGGRKPTPRSVRIVSLDDSFAGPVETSEKGKGISGNASREPTDQTVVGMSTGGARAKVNAPAAARVFARGSYPMPHNPTAFLPSSAQPMSPYAYTQGFPNALGTGHGPPTQPRFNAKNLNLQILLNPSRWMKLYFWLWPVLVFYHIPLQTFFDFNAVYILIQVSKFPSSTSSRKNWALGAAAYIACWLAWIFFVCVLYELIYSFTRRWRLRRPLILPIFLSSPAFNLAAMTSYTTFSFLQYLRFSAFGRPEDAYLLGSAPGPNATGATTGQETDIVADTERPDTDNALAHGDEIVEVDDGLDRELTGDFGEILADEKRGGSNINSANANPAVSQKRRSFARFNFKSKSNTNSTTGTKKPSGPIAWRQGLAETFFFYSQNVPTVALLLPRAGLCLAVLFAYSSVASASFSSSINTNSVFGRRDGTFFRADGSLTGYARGILIANAAWTAWRIVVLAVSWLGLWYFSNQRLGGLCGPRHSWDEYAQEKTRARYSMATSEYEAYRASSYGGAYGGDGERRSDYGGDELAWAWRETTRTRVQDAFEFCLVTRKMRGFNAGPGQGLRWNTPPTRQASGYNERQKGKTKEGEEGFEGIEKVLAAVGFGGGPSPARRGVLSQDLFSGPPPKMGALESDSQPLPSTSKAFVPLSVNTDLEKPKMAKRNSKDKDDFGSGPIMSLPYPFSRPGAGQVSSKDSVPFPAAATSSNIPRKKSGSKKSASEKAESGSGSHESRSGSSEGVEEEEEEEDEEEDEEDEEDEDEEEDDEEDEEDEEDEDEEDDFEGSEEPSSGRASGSMSSLGQPISPSSRFHNPFGTRRRHAGAGHGRSMSGVSSAFSSGTGAGSVATHSTGNRETAESSGPIQYPIPMPPRHPAAAAGGGRGRTGHVPVAFPSVQTRPRVHSGAGIVVDPSSAYGHDQDEHEGDDDDDDDEAHGEHEDSVGLLGLPSSARNSRVSLSNTSSSGLRSRTHSHQSVRSRTRTHSSSRGTPSSRSISAVRERANSMGASMRSFVHSAASASLTQLDNIMRGATGPAAGLGGIGGPGSTHSSSSGSRPRSRVNSSMARLEEDVVLDLPPVYHHPLHHHDDIEAYSSSGGTHSRSGSESLSHLSAENYTFGRPMTFTRVPPPPSPVTEQPEVPDSPIGIPAAQTEAESPLQPPIMGGLPQSLESQSFYSQEEGSVSPTPTGLPASVPIPIHISSSPNSLTGSAMTALSSSPLSSSDDHSRSRSSERQGVPIPWSAAASSSRRPASLVPPTPNTLALPPRNMNANVATTSSSGSPPDISSAAGSFVTAPATLETESATVSNNSHLSLSTVGADESYGVWGLANARQRRISGTGGPLVDRPAEDMGAGGAGGSGWHIM